MADPNAPQEVDDLDALLDEAMNMVDEQERKHEEDVKQRDAKLNEDLQRALDEAEGKTAALDGPQADLAKMLQAVMGGDGSMDDAAFDSFKRDVKALVDSLEGVEDLADEDKANLSRVKDLMSVMENDDEVRAQELLSQIEKEEALKMPEGALAGLDGDLKPGDMDAAMRRCMEALKDLSDSSGGAGAAMAAAAAASASPEAASSAAAPAGNLPAPMQGMPDNLASMLLDTLIDPDFIAPIKVMRDAYEPWLAAHPDITDSERETYHKQHEKTKVICAFLAEKQLTREDDERLVQLLELMSEFSELGEPPKDLAKYAPAGREGSTS